jgi:uncharacterized membrane protein (UPF0127 family)
LQLKGLSAGRRVPGMNLSSKMLGLAWRRGMGPICLAALLFAVGCEEKQASAPPPPPAAAEGAGTPAAQPAENKAATRTSEDGALAAATDRIQAPQPRLQTVPLWVGAKEVKAELAVTREEIMAGMMWRTNMAEMEGMLFVFNGPNSVSFWMKNTLLPLSCAYINPEGEILEIYDMKPKDLSPIPSASDKIQYVLEVNQGWFQRQNVSTGMVVRTPFGSLKETFFKSRR